MPPRGSLIRQTDGVKDGTLPVSEEYEEKEVDGNDNDGADDDDGIEKGAPTVLTS